MSTRFGIDYRSALVNREGIGRYTRELVRALVQLDFEEELGLFGCTLAPARFSAKELGIRGSKARLKRLRLPSRWLPKLLYKLDRGVDDLLGGCAVYHHTQPNLLEVREAAQVATIFDTIYMLDAGYMDAESSARMTATARRLAARATVVMVPCAYVGAEVVMSLGVSPDRIVVTFLGCEHVLRHLPPPGKRKQAEPYLLTVCRVDARKNHLRMLRAFEQLVREGHELRWIIAGPPGFGHEHFLEALAHSPARHLVQWRRKVSERELPALYAGARAFLFASLNEGFGLPPVEAMACGTPVVTSCVTSLPEVCADAALYVEPTEVDEIFEATRRLLTDEELARELVQRGERRAGELSWENCARATLEAYRLAAELAAEDRSRSTRVL